MSETATHNPLWQVGATVFDQYGSRFTIAEFQENGNFRLADIHWQSWCPIGTCARAVGGNVIIYADTPENREFIAEAARISARKDQSNG